MKTFVRAHPVLSAFAFVCIAGGAVLGVTLLSSEWSVARRAVGGSLGGFGVMLCVAANKMFE